jgi:hypothetical protein
MTDSVGPKRLDTGVPVEGLTPRRKAAPNEGKAATVSKPTFTPDGPPPSTVAPDRPVTVAMVGNLPAVGTPEAALLNQLHGQPGIPPQTQDAFLQLSPGEQRALGELFGQMQWSFCIRPPAAQQAMAKAFSQMDEAHQADFLKLAPSEQHHIAQFHASISPAHQQALLRRSPAEQKQIAAAYAGLSPTGKTAFAMLSADQQAEYGRGWGEAGRIDLHGAKAPNALSPGDIRRQLDQLLISGKLTAAGTDGKTTLDHLDRMRTQPLALPPGTPETIYRQILFNHLVTELADPRTIQQGVNGTCGATCAQREFARYLPADYASFVTGLVSAEGRARLPNGEIVTRPAGCLVAYERTATDREGHTLRMPDDRTAVDRIVQASLMHYGSPVTYENARDTNSVVGISLGPGLSGSRMAKLYNSLRPEQGVILASDSIITILDGGNMTGVTKTSLAKGIAQQLHVRPGKTIPTEVHWSQKPGTLSGGLHWIEVTAVNDGRVYIQNPHGNSFPAYQQGNLMLPRDAFTGLRYIALDGSDGTPPRRIHEDGTESVDRTWFNASVEEALVDPQLADQVKAQKENRLDFSGVL